MYIKVHSSWVLGLQCASTASQTVQRSVHVLSVERQIRQTVCAYTTAAKNMGTSHVFLGRSMWGYHA